MDSQFSVPMLFAIAQSENHNEPTLTRTKYLIKINIHFKRHFRIFPRQRLI